MAITNCPSCNARISSRAKQCPDCGFNMQAGTEEDLDRKRRHQRYMKVQSVNNQSMFAMLLFVIGFGYGYWEDLQPPQVEYYVAMGSAAIGFVWYLVNRVRMVLLKKSK